jgi:hypothetical protein
LKFYKEPQAIKRQRAEKCHNYVKYISTPFGGVSATQSSIQTTVIAKSEDNAIPAVAEPDAVAELDECNNWIDEDDNERYKPPLDPAYLEHISREVADSDEHLKRDRPKGVS